MSLAPVVLFVYNRPDHALQTLEALSKNDLAKDSVLYIYADGPKVTASEDDLIKIEETRKLIKSYNWCKETIIVESATNSGLANSIIKGVKEVVNRHGKIIVLEDDIVTSRGFLTFMNSSLDIYEKNPKVMHVSGYTYPVNFITKGNSTFFLNVFSCWGWATWKRAWDHYEHDLIKLSNNLITKKDIAKFNIEGHGDYYDQLMQNKEGLIYTWAVRWYASWLFAGGSSLFPQKSLVTNIGFDRSGVHCEGKDFYRGETVDRILVTEQPIIEYKENRLILDKFFEKNNPTVDRVLLKYKMRMISVLKTLGLFNSLRDLFRWLKRSKV